MTDYQIIPPYGDDDARIIVESLPPFDGSRDVAKFTFEEAVTAAHERASGTGVRQIVRPRTPLPTADDHIVPRFIVQAI